MIFPKFIKKNDTIGITALSDGVEKESDKIRFNNGKKQLKDKGYKIKFTNNVFTADEKGRSSSGKTRADQLHELISDKDVSWIVSAKGGNFLVEMLEHLDFSLIKENPKWIQGYSDNTSLLFAITTKLDIATLYACNFGDFGMEEWHESVRRNLDIVEGKEKTQKSFEFFEDGFSDRVTGLEGYSADKAVEWKNIRNEDSINIKGRVLGGCLDVLLTIAGTKYDGALEFIERYKDDGIVWYFESFDLNAEALMMGLWRLKELGWFKYTRGIVFGRPLIFSSFTDTSHEEAILAMLGDLNVPIITDADIGHKGPQFVMINGALASISSQGGKGEVTYLF